MSQGGAALAAPAAVPLPDGAPAGVGCFAAQLASPLAAGGSATLESVAVFTAVMRPNPSHVAQGEPQLVEYEDNLYVVSPYPVESQSTDVTLPSGNVKSWTQAAPSTRAGDSKIKYGPYERQAAWALTPLRLHFENPKPFMQVTKLVREIEVSHWGRVYVEESYEIRNAGEPTATSGSVF